MTSRAAPALLACLFLGQVLNAQTPVKPRLDALGDPLPDGAIARLGTLRFKHMPSQDPTVDVVRYAPDGTKIVSLVYGQASIRLWEADNGKEIKGKWTTRNGFTAVAFSPDSKMLAAAVQPASGGGKKKGDKAAPTGSLHLYTIGSAEPMKTLPGPTTAVQALVFADGGKTLIAAGNGSVTWWDIATGKELRAWQPFADEPPRFEGLVRNIKTFIQCVLAPDGKTIAVHAMWLPENGNRGGPGQNRNNLDNEAVGYDLSSGKKIWRLQGMTKQEGRNPNGRFAYSADSKRVAVVLEPFSVHLRDTMTGKLIVPPKDMRIEGNKLLGGLALSSDGTQVALAGDEGQIHFWKVGSTEPERKLVARIAQYWGNCTMTLDFSPDDKTLLAGVDADLQQYDMASLKELHASEGHRGWIDFVSFTPDGQRLLTGSADINMHPQELVAWDTTTWKSLQMTSLRHPVWPKMGIVSSDQAVFVGKSGADRFGLFDSKSGALISRMLSPAKQNNGGRGFFSPAGDFYILSCSDEKGEESERLYSATKGKLLCQLPALGMLNRAMDSTQPIAFSCDNKLVALAGRKDAKIHIVEIATGKTRHVLGAGLPKEDPNAGMPFNNREGVSANLAFSRDGRFLASWMMQEGFVRVWDVATGKELLFIQPVDRLSKKSIGPERDGNMLHFAWSPDSRVLAVGESNISLWELASLRKRRELPGHGTGAVRALSYAPNGQVLASGSADTTVLIWDVANAASPLPESISSDPADLEKRWQALAGDEADKAFVAILELVATPKEAVAWIGERLKPAVPVDPKIVTELIAQLDDEQFKIRQKAYAELLKIGESAIPILDKALESKPSLETQSRLEILRKGVTGMVLKGDNLRMVRALEVLERIGNPEARQILEALAGGGAGAVVTAQAKIVLDRWRP
jgi:WD40 repeat protein